MSEGFPAVPAAEHHAETDVFLYVGQEESRMLANTNYTHQTITCDFFKDSDLFPHACNTGERKKKNMENLKSCDQDCTSKLKKPLQSKRKCQIKTKLPADIRVLKALPAAHDCEVTPIRLQNFLRFFSVCTQDD